MTVSLRTRQYWMAKERSELKNGMYENLLHAPRPYKENLQKNSSNPHESVFTWVAGSESVFGYRCYKFRSNFGKEIYQEVFKYFFFFLFTEIYQRDGTASDFQFQCVCLISTSNLMTICYMQTKKLSLQSWPRHLNYKDSNQQVLYKFINTKKRRMAAEKFYHIYLSVMVMRSPSSSLYLRSRSSSAWIRPRNTRCKINIIQIKSLKKFHPGSTFPMSPQNPSPWQKFYSECEGEKTEL